MNIHPYAMKIHPDVTAWRHHMHAHPELSLQEYKTIKFIKTILDGLDVPYQSFTDTGIIATLKKGTSNRAIGIRCDIDALPIHEENTFAHASTVDGVMHACGHDGHTAMVLGAIKTLKTQGDFDGTVHFIFQPAEEKFGGARKMIAEGALDACPMHEVYALHNWPGVDVGTVAATKGPMMASVDTFTVSITGKGGHPGLPHLCNDPISIASQLLHAYQSIVPRNTDPVSGALVSISTIHAGDVSNVIPDTVKISASVRAFCPKVRDMIKQRMETIARGFSIAFDCHIINTYEDGCHALINDPKITEYAVKAIETVVGTHNIHWNIKPSTAGEDFSDFLQHVPGNYLWLGIGNTGGNHTATYDFNDDVLPIGISYWVALSEHRLPTQK